jgi:hypothetical protein
MRRSWAVAAAIVMCLALGGVPVSGQSPSEPSSAVWVTGTATCPTVEDGTTDTVGGVEQVRGRVAECTYTASDPRVAEPTTNTSDWNCYALTPAGTGHGCWGWGTLESPNWTGYGTIVTQDSGRFVSNVTMIGRGTNAGWTFILTDTPEGFSGLLYEGDPPPFEPLPAPASE